MNNTLNFDVRQTLLFEKMLLTALFVFLIYYLGTLLFLELKLLTGFLRSLENTAEQFFVSHIFSKPLLSKIHLFFHVSCTYFCNAFR